MFRNNFGGFGNAGNDATSRKVGDKDVASVRLAVSNGKNKDGTDKEPLWLNIEAWGPLSARLATVKKGDRFGVEGRLVIEEYEKDGATRTSVKIVASDIAYLSARKEGAAEGSSDDNDDGETPF